MWNHSQNVPVKLFFALPSFDQFYLKTVDPSTNFGRHIFKWSFDSLTLCQNTNKKMVKLIFLLVYFTTILKKANLREKIIANPVKCVWTS